MTRSPRSSASAWPRSCGTGASGAPGCTAACDPSSADVRSRMTDRIDTSQWQRLGALFDQAIGLGPAEQAELVRATERDDVELAQALASLLAADARHHAHTSEHRERLLKDSLAAIDAPSVA